MFILHAGLLSLTLMAAPVPAQNRLAMGFPSMDWASGMVACISPKNKDSSAQGQDCIAEAAGIDGPSNYKDHLLMAELALLLSWLILPTAVDGWHPCSSST